MKVGKSDELFLSTSSRPVVKSQILAVLVLGDTCIALLRRIVMNTTGLLLLVKVTTNVHGSSVFLAIREPVVPC